MGKMVEELDTTLDEFAGKYYGIWEFLFLFTVSFAFYTQNANIYLMPATTIPRIPRLSNFIF